MLGSLAKRPMPPCSEVLPWRCRDGRAGSDYLVTAPDGGAEPTEETR
jgi:hypothetical protein